jgi:hypothetical protein
VEYHRKQAKALVRGHHAGDAQAVRRAEAILGARARERFALSDAQHVIAREQGFRTWAELKHSVATTGDPGATAWMDDEDVVVGTHLTYAPGKPVDVIVRKRGWRFDVSDDGAAVAAAGSPPGWLAVAKEVVDEHALNVNRRGVVFVQANEARVDALVERVAACSVDLYEELLESELGSS